MPPDLSNTTDAMVWAEEFVRICREHKIDPLDESFMVGWFANAMRAQEAKNAAEPEAVLRWVCGGCREMDMLVPMPGYPGDGYNHYIDSDPERPCGPLIALRAPDFLRAPAWASHEDLAEASGA
jgi:hypothetical protein